MPHPLRPFTGPPSFARWSAPRRIAAAAGAAALLATAAACGGSGSGGDKPSGASAGEACKAATGKVELSFWTWVPGIDKAAALWNSKNPNIQVKVEQTPQGNQGTYSKMFNALKAKQAPDLGQVEFDSIPQFRVQQGLQNIASCPGVAEAKSKFVNWTWQQVSLGGDGVYAVPQDSGPMAMYYRKDLFAKHNIAVPTTWDEYAQAAEKLHKADPKLYITHFPQKDVNWYAGLVWQAGGRWFSQDGQKWKVDLSDPGSTKVAQFWQGLIDKKLVANLQGFSDSWNKALNDGELATWTSAVWGLNTVMTAAPKTSGKWAVAPLPQWQAGEQKAGNWGGSTTAVLAGTAHPAEAAKFALWLNTDPEALEITKKEGGLYPATLDAQAALTASPELTKFYGGQNVYEVFNKAGQQVSQDFVFGPTMQQTYSHAQDGFAGVLSGSKTIEQVMADTAKATVQDLQQQSIPVAGQ